VLHRVAPAGEAETAAIALAREVAQHDPAAVRALKAALDAGVAERVAAENDALVAWTRAGGTLGRPSSAGGRG
jgi:1,4-dihydroxy-2-naphthoyl-CoA synthase